MLTHLGSGGFTNIQDHDSVADFFTKDATVRSLSLAIAEVSVAMRDDSVSKLGVVRAINNTGRSYSYLTGVLAESL